MNDAAAEVEFLTVEVGLALHQRQLVAGLMVGRCGDVEIITFGPHP